MWTWRKWPKAVIVCDPPRCRKPASSPVQGLREPVIALDLWHETRLGGCGRRLRRFGRRRRSAVRAGLPRRRVATAEDFDGRFHYCRLVYRGAFNGNGGSWRTDYPNADINMSIRLSELTKIGVSKERRRVSRITCWSASGGDELFQCPLVIMSAPGSALIEEAEASRLREYLLKGGMLWTDDSWGSYQWQHWVCAAPQGAAGERVSDLRRAARSRRSSRRSSRSPKIPQIPNIGFFLRSGGGTSEQGADSATPVRARDCRSRRPAHGVDDAQHRHPGLMGARGRGPVLLLRLQSARLRLRHQRHPLRADALTGGLKASGYHDESYHSPVAGNLQVSGHPQNFVLISGNGTARPSSAKVPRSAISFAA